MTDTAPPSPPAERTPSATVGDEDASGTAPPTTAPPPRRRRRWLRWLLVLVLLLLVARGLAMRALPGLVADLASEHGLDVRYERLVLSLLSVDVELWHLEVDTLEGEPVLAAEFVRADVSVSDLLFGDLVVRRLELDGVDASLTRRADGSFDIVNRIERARADGSGGATRPTTDDGSDDARSSDDAGDDARTLELPFAVDALRLQHLALHFVDETLDPPLDTTLTGHLRVSSVGFPQRDTRVELDLAARGLVDGLRLTATGSNAPRSARARLDLVGHGLDVERAASYLALIGLRPTAGPLRLELSLETTLELVEGGVSIDAELLDASVHAARTQVVDIRRAQVEGMSITDAGFAIERAELEHVHGEIGTAADGGFRVGSIEFVPGEADDEADDDDSDEVDDEGGGGFRLGDVTLADLDVGYVDERDDAPPERRLVVPSLHLTALDLDATEDDPPATLDATLRLPGVVERLALAGEASLFGDAKRATLQISGDAIALPEARPPLGDTLDVDTTIDAAWSIEADALDARLQLGATALASRGVTVLALDDLEASVEAAILDADSPWPGVERAALTLAAPGWIGALRVDASVDTAGGRSHALARLDASGIDTARLRPLLASAGLQPTLGDASLALALDATLAQDGALDVSVTELALAEAGQTLLAADTVAIAGFRAGDDGLSVDRVTLARPTLAARRDADGALLVPGLRLAPSAADNPANDADTSPTPPPPPATDAREPVDGAPPPPIRVAALRIDGARLAWSDDAVTPAVGATATLDLSVDGFDTSAGSPPADVSIRLGVDETLDSLVLRGRVLPAPAAPEIDLSLEALGLRPSVLGAYLPAGITSTLADGRLSGEISFATEAVGETGRRVSMAVRELELSEHGRPLLALPELLVDAPRLDAAAGVQDFGRVRIVGLRAEVTRGAGGALRVAGLEITPGADTPADEVSIAPTASPPPPPLPDMHLEQLDVEVAALTFVDEAHGGTRHEATLRARTLEPVTMLADDPDASSAVRLEVTAGLRGVLDEFAIRVAATPFAQDATFDVHVDARGLRGDALQRLFPTTSTLDATGLRDGRLAGRVRADWNGRRLGPLDFDPVELDIEIDDLTFRDGPDGEVLAGLTLLRADDLVVASGRTSVRTIELVRPVLIASRTAAGLDVLGLHVPAPTIEPGTTGAAGASSAPAAPTTAAGDAGAGAARGAGFSVDRAYVSDIDARYRDSTYTPPLDLAVNDLELQVAGFTTDTFVQPVPFYFDVLLGTRRAVDEIDVEGRLALFPRPVGWVATNVRGLQLPVFAGPVAAAGVTLNDGTLDATVELDFEESGALDTKSVFVLRNLSMSEPADGPIARLLKLPAPLDAILFVLRNQNGVIRLPISFRLGADGVGTGQILATTVSSLSTLIAKAVANSPIRVLSTVGDLATLGGIVPLDRIGGEIGEMTRINRLPVIGWIPWLQPASPIVDGEVLTVPFAPASDVVPAPTVDAEFARLIELLRADESAAITLRHEFGTRDVALTRDRANPSREDALGLVNGLRLHKSALYTEREAAARRLEAAIGAWQTDAIASATEETRQIDAELARIEDALDDLLALLRSGAERSASRRTRNASVALAEARLAAVRRALDDAGVENLDTRLRIIPARFTDPVEELGRVNVQLHLR